MSNSSEGRLEKAVQFFGKKMAGAARAPDSGVIDIILPMKPPSVQSKSSKKNQVREVLRKIARNANFLLSGDVKITIEWSVSEQARYESDEKPDVDNIIKPLLDGLSGPEGLLIDDCQVQSVQCYWIDEEGRGEEVFIRTDFVSDEWVYKKDLSFVHLGNNFCMPINTGWPLKARQLALDLLEKQLKMRNRCLTEGVSYDQARYFMSVQRCFHRTRLRGFKIYELKKLREAMAREGA